MQVIQLYLNSTLTIHIFSINRSQVVLGFTTKNSFVVYLKSSGTGCPAFLFEEPGAFDPGCGGSSRVGRLCAFSRKGWHPLKAG